MTIPYLKPILIGVLLAAWAGSIWYARQDAADDVRAEWNEERRLQAVAAGRQEADKREKDAERFRIAEQVGKDAQAKVKEQASQLAKYDSAVKRLRATEATLRAAIERRSDTTTGERSPVDGSPSDLLTNMQARLDQAQREHTVYTDELRIRHEACVRQYNEIRDTQNKKAP